jgi:adenosylcobinamide-phosphate synthase
MSFFSILFALLIEQLKPLPRSNSIHHFLFFWLGWVEKNFNAGRNHHAWAVWLISNLMPVILVYFLYLWLSAFGFIFNFILSVAILYFTLGFRQFSYNYTDIKNALSRGDESEARRLLSEWQHLDTSELPKTELIRQVIEHSLLAAHKHVFGVFFWFVILSSFGLGPIGAVLYRMTEYSSRYWSSKTRTGHVAVNERLLSLSQRLFNKLDYLPARLTAFGFAVVGNFEEAITGWRRDAFLWKQPNEGVILAAAAGAVGVQLGEGFAPGIASDRVQNFETAGAQKTVYSQGLTQGRAPEIAHLSSVVGLIWRSVILWMLFLALLSVAHLVG